ncbi:MAG: hypothetical protein II507_13890, partial [Treponema sp.]|nr:hypothetical protein [Treponema sp.]
MKKVVRIFTMLSVLAIGGLLICCSGGGSSSDDDDAPAVSTTSTTTTTTPTIITTQTNYLARVMYTVRRGEYINEGLADANHDLYEGYAVPQVMMVSHMRVEPIDDLSTNPETARFYIMADAGFYLEIQGNLYSALVLPDGIIGNEIDPVTNYWV